MKKFMLSIVLLVVILLTASSVIMSNKMPLFIQKQEHETKVNHLTEQTKLLQDSIADLEKKVRILNYYLHAKHLEYIDACQLVNSNK